MRIFSLALLLGVVQIGCVPLKTIPLETLDLRATQPVDGRLHTERRFVVARFVDGRGAAFSQQSATNYMPVVNWVHQGFTLSYPEQLGLRGVHHGEAGVATGTLDVAMARLLAAQIRNLGLSSNSTSSADAAVVPQRVDETDYVVSGRLVRSSYKEQQSPILGVALGMLGVPFVFTHFELEFEVYLYRSGFPEQPLWRHTYRHAMSLAGGFYYNRQPAYRMVVQALEATLPRVVNDLAQVVAVDSYAAQAPIGSSVPPG